jgi:methylase of polypeptide subunit release factors
LYTQARQIRTLEGHDAAQSLYEEILTLNKNDFTAATRIARHPNSIQRHFQLGASGTLSERREFTHRLQALNFTPDAIAEWIFPKNNSQKAKESSAPLYLQPLKAGSPTPPLPTCSLSTCIQIFLLAVCLPVEICQKFLGDDMISLMQKLGVAFQDDDGWMVPYCHVMPVTVVNKTLYLATDLHPNVLSTTTIGSDEGTVMYIGPDSLALLDHWNSRQQLPSGSHIVDIGTGSGIQALSLAALCYPGEVHVTCVDINPRALRLARLNFDWNGMEEPTLILGDIQNAIGRLYKDNSTLTWQEALGRPNMILANPPFLPVPVQDAEISKRYGLFSSGGASGDIILQRIVELASESLSSSSGTLAIVSEFMNPQSEFPQRLQSWWGSGGSAQAMLFSNEQAMGAETYAQRRADSEKEVERWRKHLEDEKITHISPGLLFVKKTIQVERDDGDDLRFSHHLVPKTTQGSIWTPTNRNARGYTQNILDSLWNTQDRSL